MYFARTLEFPGEFCPNSVSNPYHVTPSGACVCCLHASCLFTLMVLRFCFQFDKPFKKMMFSKLMLERYDSKLITRLRDRIFIRFCCIEMAPKWPSDMKTLDSSHITMFFLHIYLLNGEQIISVSHSLSQYH